jgi:hypothetical protein
MGEESRSIYDGLQSRLGNYPVGEFACAYAKAYFEADVETIKKLRELLGVSSEYSEPEDYSETDAMIGAPLTPRPHPNSGAIALPEPDNTGLDHSPNLE